MTATPRPEAPPTPAPLGVTYSGWRGGFADAAHRLDAFRRLGFPLVSFVPAYSYVARNKVDLASAPSADELGRAIERALALEMMVVVKPHLDPPAYQPGFDSFTSDNFSWRAQCPWRGFFDVDPTAPDYRDGVVLALLHMLKTVLDRRAGAAGPPIRLELGVEL